MDNIFRENSMKLLKPHWSLLTRWAGCFGLALGAQAVYAQGVVTKELGGEKFASKLSYVSAFSHYQGFQAQSVLSWRASNQTVSDVGGWMAYAKEARQPEASTPTEAANKPVDHNQHGKHQHGTHQHRNTP